ncbi:hypothetical protein ZWY2020_029164 [Hordeum vulgare]|nr:hypothetical protein ZWY2020_029164 [Hordeum vulgare]
MAPPPPPPPSHTGKARARPKPPLHPARGSHDNPGRRNAPPPRLVHGEEGAPEIQSIFRSSTPPPTTARSGSRRPRQPRYVHSHPTFDGSPSFAAAASEFSIAKRKADEAAAGEECGPKRKAEAAATGATLGEEEAASEKPSADAVAESEKALAAATKGDGAATARKKTRLPQEEVDRILARAVDTSHPPRFIEALRSKNPSLLPSPEEETDASKVALYATARMYYESRQSFAEYQAWVPASSMTRATSRWTTRPSRSGPSSEHTASKRGRRFRPRLIN